VTVPLAPGASAPVKVHVTGPVAPEGGAGVQAPTSGGSGPHPADAGT
jgi:hypothetical protein